jgi:hypothetical protein
MSALVRRRRGSGEPRWALATGLPSQSSRSTPTHPGSPGSASNASAAGNLRRLRESQGAREAKSASEPVKRPAPAAAASTGVAPATAQGKKPAAAPSNVRPLPAGQPATARSAAVPGAVAPGTVAAQAGAAGQAGAPPAANGEQGSGGAPTAEAKLAGAERGAPPTMTLEHPAGRCAGALGAAPRRGRCERPSKAHAVAPGRGERRPRRRLTRCDGLDGSCDARGSRGRPTASPATRRPGVGSGAHRLNAAPALVPAARAALHRGDRGRSPGGRHRRRLRHQRAHAQTQALAGEADVVVVVGADRAR